MSVADFRSDTVTRPTPAMLEAMAQAELGDDVLGHDPTTQRLEEEAARITGKDAALFMPSGTMCNLVALQTHTNPGDQVIVEQWSHTACFEGGGAGMLAHVMVRTLPSPRGLMDAQLVRDWMLPRSEHTPGTSLVCVEQTHNFHGGVVMPLKGLQAIADAARAGGAKVHMDGARLFNAVAASGTSAVEQCAIADTVSFCLSKGLCAPVGSLLCGSADFVERARFNRKRLGGGMRQSGVIAAAGRIALRDMAGRLGDDHDRARRLAAGIAAIGGPYDVDAGAVDTNILFVGTGEVLASTIVEAGAREDVLLYATGEHQIRFVTHHDVDDGHVDRLLDLLRRMAA
jgi:threonine aldolase